MKMVNMFTYLYIYIRDRKYACHSSEAKVTGTQG